MFLDLQKAVSTHVSYDFMYWEKSLFTDVTFLKNVGILVLVNFKAVLLAQFLVVELNFLHQNVCRIFAKVIISVSQVNRYCFELRKMRISAAPSRQIGNYAMVTLAIGYTDYKLISVMPIMDFFCDAEWIAIGFCFLFPFTRPANANFHFSIPMQKPIAVA